MTNQNKFKILIIEDEPFARQALEMLIADLGHLSRASSSISDAIRELETFSADVVFTDLKLGNESIDGSALGKLSGNRIRPVVLITGTSSDVIAPDLQVEFHRILTKPMDFSEIETLLAELEKKSTAARIE